MPQSWQRPGGQQRKRPQMSAKQPHARCPPKADDETVTLPQPGPATLLTAWEFEPLLVIAAAVLAVGYAAGLQRLRRAGRRWPRGRTCTFAIGLLALVWMGCGFPGRYDSALYWVWTARILVLWLIVPIVVLAGAPIQLTRAAGRSARLDRLLRSRVARFISNPLIGPALVPVLSGVLFFGPLAGWSIEFAPVGWLLDVAVVLIGALMVLPLIGLDDDASSLAVGLSLAIGSFELVLDALPGVVLRLHTTAATSWFAHREIEPWTPAALRDQQVAGAILWCVAELIDVPFLLLMFRRWLRADARDAAQVDAVLEAERAARRALRTTDSTDGEHVYRDGVPPAAGSDDAEDALVERDVPWWESDPAMRERLRRRG
jgi:putative membrane protein